MSQTVRKLMHISAADDPAAENGGLRRRELVDGVVYAMAGARPARPGSQAQHGMRPGMGSRPQLGKEIWEATDGVVQQV